VRVQELRRANDLAAEIKKALADIERFVTGADAAGPHTKASLKPAVCRLPSDL